MKCCRQQHINLFLLLRSSSINIPNMSISLNILRYGRMKNAVGIYLSIEYLEEQTGSNIVI